jgi:hypothetical protein
VHPNRVVSRERLIDELLGDQATGAAKHTLRRSRYDLLVPVRLQRKAPEPTVAQKAL